MTILGDRVYVKTATTGTGTLTLGVVVGNEFCTFAEAGIANASTVRYLIEEGSDFEIGTGVYTTAGTTLSRVTVNLSKIAGTAGTTKLTLAGGARVRVVASAIDIQSGVQITGGTIAGITDLAVADGGTGSSTAGGALTNLGVTAAAQTVTDDTTTELMRATLNAARCAVGGYTGDGSTGTAIEIGFQPKFVQIWKADTADATALTNFTSSSNYVDNNASGMAYFNNAAAVTTVINRIIAFGATSFTVDDAGSDQPPNKNAEAYEYLAIG